jgi:hypothetical protein
MKIEITATSKTFAVETDSGREITVIENYDANSDHTETSMFDINSNDELDSGDPLYNEILNEINNL